MKHFYLQDYDIMDPKKFFNTMLIMNDLNPYIGPMNHLVPQLHKLSDEEV